MLFRQVKLRKIVIFKLKFVFTVFKNHLNNLKALKFKTKNVKKQHLKAWIKLIENQDLVLKFNIAEITHQGKLIRKVF